MKTEVEVFDPTRRKLVTGIALSPLVAIPFSVEAGVWRYLRLLSQLSLARIISGLVLDVASTVVVNYLNKRNDGSYASFSSLPLNEMNFDVEPYKRAVIEITKLRFGLSDEEFEHYRSKAHIILSQESDLNRYETIHRFLMDNKARIASYGDNSSRLVKSSMTPDHLFNSQYMVFNDKSQEWAYRSLLEKTEVTAFDHWIV